MKRLNLRLVFSGTETKKHNFVTTIMNFPISQLCGPLNPLPASRGPETSDAKSGQGRKRFQRYPCTLCQAMTITVTAGQSHASPPIRAWQGDKMWPPTHPLRTAGLSFSIVVRFLQGKRREKESQTEIDLGRQHDGVDRFKVG